MTTFSVLARGGMLSALLALLGCVSTPSEEAPPALLFLGEGAAGGQPYLQTSLGGVAPQPAGLPSPAGHLQTSSVGRLLALTVGAEPGGSASLQLLRLDASLRPAERWTLAKEWAYDFHLRPEGDVIAWVAGWPTRRLFLARAPRWEAQPVATSEGAVPSDPRWLDARRLAVVLQYRDRSEVALLDLEAGSASVLYHARSGSRLSDLRPIPRSSDLLLVESPETAETAEPARILSVPVAAGPARELSRGWFVPGSLSVSPDGAFRATASAPDLASLRQQATRLEWLGPVWSGAADAAAGVEALAWSPDGRRLALTRVAGGRRLIELRTRSGPPVTAGFSDTSCTSPQWWPAPSLP